jgi:hypothetical protein
MPILKPLHPLSEILSHPKQISRERVRRTESPGSAIGLRNPRPSLSCFDVQPFRVETREPLQRSLTTLQKELLRLMQFLKVVLRMAEVNLEKAWH